MMGPARPSETVGPPDDIRYRLVFEKSHVGILFASVDGTILAANPALCRMWGCPEDGLIGRSVTSMAHPEERAEAVRNMDALRSGQSTDLRVRRRFLRPDGRVVWGESSTQPIEGPDGSAYWQSVIVDVTEQVQSAQAATQLGIVVESAPDAMVSVDPGGRIALANTQTEKLFGYPAGELVGRPAGLLFPHNSEGDERRSRAAVARVRPGRDPLKSSILGRRRDGTEFPAEISVTATDTDQGRVVWLAVRDGTERLQAAIVASSTDAIVGRSLDGEITSWNPGAEQMYGYTAEEALGTEMLVMLTPGRADEVPALTERIRRGETVEHYETQRVCKDGRVIDVDVTMSPIRAVTGELVGTSSVARDITERRRAEAERDALAARLRQSERLESLGQLAGGVAHDFNNLLGAILTYTEFVAEETTDRADLQADLAQIRAAAERGARLTRQLLIVGRRDPMRPEMLDLNEIVAETRDLLSRSVGAHIDLHVRLDAPGPNILGDRGQVEQVVLNLVVNARDAMPDGGVVSISTRLASYDDEYVEIHAGGSVGQYVELSVSDTGIGMTQEVAERVFEPFFTTKPKDQGTGLGLATVYSIVTASGGSVSLQSEPGTGTTVRVLFPVPDQLAPATDPP